MSLRIIAGEFGGRILPTPNTTKTHPMGDRIRSSLFNMLGDLSGMMVLDAFAGSGSLGFESLSRGAERVTFIERERIVQKTLRESIELLGVRDRAKLVSASVASWDETSLGQQFDVIFADPPYHDLQLSTVSRLTKHLSPNGLMVLSYPGRESTPTVNGVVVVDNRKYGDAALAFYRLES